MMAVVRYANSMWPVLGPEVMRLALTAVGLGWLATPTRWPILKQITEVTYDWFARHRVGLFRRCGGLFALLNPE
jgi:predicted DCC family thiol-disulfide oxidoreductase YuxK